MSDQRHDEGGEEEAGGLRAMAIDQSSKQQAEESGITIHVSGIGRTVTQADLESLFGEKYGQV